MRRRVPLPNTRAVVGGLLVAVAAVGGFALATPSDEGPSTRYVVAVRDIAPGERVERDDLAVEAMALADATAARAFGPGDLARLTGTVAVAPLVAGDLVLASAVAPGATTRYQVALALDADRAVAGELDRGDLVDVLGTIGSGAQAVTTALVRGAVVEDAPDRDDTLSTRRVIVTLGLATTAEVDAVVHAHRAGEVTLVRATAARAGAGAAADVGSGAGVPAGVAP